MTIPAPDARDSKPQLRKAMGFWDVLLFNIAAVLGPRWIAAAGHNGTSSISLWVLAALFFFVPGALVINELSSRFPEEGGIYAWARDAFGPFHGFIAGWSYWIYTIFYFPGLLLASAAMCAYISSSHGDSSRAKPSVPALGFARHAYCRGPAQHHRSQHRQMASERRRRRKLCALADSGLRRRRHLCAPWLRHAFHHPQHDAHLELGHGQLLVADCIRIYRPRTCLVHGRGSPQSAPHAAPRSFRRGRPHRHHVHCRNLCRPGPRSRRRTSIPRAASFMPSPWARRLSRLDS